MSKGFPTVSLDLSSSVDIKLLPPLMKMLITCVFTPNGLAVEDITRLEVNHIKSHPEFVPTNTLHLKCIFTSIQTSNHNLHKDRMLSFFGTSLPKAKTGG